MGVKLILVFCCLFCYVFSRLSNLGPGKYRPIIHNLKIMQF